MIAKFVKGRLYLLSKDWQEYYDNETDGRSDNPCVGYHLAKAVHSGDFEVCDCWIVNSDGDVHPGYSNSPVPVNRESLFEI